MTPHGLHVIFKKILLKAGLPPKRFSLHRLRHTFATLLLQQADDRVDHKTLQELLGHESLATTSMYTHIDFEQKKKAIDSFKLYSHCFEPLLSHFPQLPRQVYCFVPYPIFAAEPPF